MKLYKDDKIMQSVGKDQVEICLEAGWSKTKPEPEPEVITDDKDEAVATPGTDDSDEAPEAPEKDVKTFRKRPVIARTVKKK